MARTQGWPEREHLRFVLPQTTAERHVPAGARHPSPSPSLATYPTLLRTATSRAARAEPAGDPPLCWTCQTAGGCRYTLSFTSGASQGPVESWSVFYNSRALPPHP